MSKKGMIFFILTLVIVGIIALTISFYARGYRIDSENLQIESNGTLVIKSHPDGAQVIINGEQETITNANIQLPPNTYDIIVRKEGFLDWEKRLTIEKEEVTQTTAHLFKSVPSLSPITLLGLTNPTISHDLSKIAYIVPPIENGNNITQNEDSGLWVIDIINLPLGFSRDPRIITDGNLEGATITWSPDSREILLETDNSAYFLDIGKFTPQKERENVAFKRETINTNWQEESQDKLNALLRQLPDELRSIIQRKALSIAFSADEDMIVYTASGSAEIPTGLEKPLPGSSTQKEDRSIKADHTYVYDIKEDKNFLIDKASSGLAISGSYRVSQEGTLNFQLSTFPPGRARGNSQLFNRRLSWFHTSRHLILAEEGKITIMDYDGTNRKEIYAGSYVSPNAFPTASIDSLIILTNLGANSSPANLYSLSLK